MAIKDYIGSACEVKTMNNDLLLNGRLSALLPQEGGLLEIVSLDNTPLITHRRGDWVKIDVFNTEKGSFIAKGRVFETSSKKWQLTEVRVNTSEERRGFFRIKTKCGAKVHKLNMPTFPASIRSISLSGVLLVTQARYQVGEELTISNLALGDDGVPFVVRCRIARMEEHPCGYCDGMDASVGVGSVPLNATLGEASSEGAEEPENEDEQEMEYHYGCAFLQMKPGESDRMCRAIFRLQHEAVRGRRYGSF